MEAKDFYPENYKTSLKERKDEIDWMDLEGIMLSEINQTEKDKCHMILLITGI